MSIRPRFRYALGAVFLAVASPCVLSAASPPATKYWDAEHLQSVRRNKEARSEEIEDALASLRDAADEALTRGPYSVVDKALTPPSGDKHDYMSFSRYWWPNPDTADGLPYIRRDGVVNRKLLSNGDRNRIGEFYDDFEKLALAAYLIDESRYAPHAAELLRTWFLDPKTRMNPNVRYAQAVPGVADGRSPGVIDTRHFIRVMDGIVLLEELDAITDEESAAFRSWFGDFLDWLLTSELGQREQRAKNNHGAWFAAQASMMALFVGRNELAESIVRQVRDERIAASFELDGSQPEELARTRSLHYSLFALSAFAVTARAGEHVGINLWSFEASGGESLKKAIDCVAPAIVDPDTWPHQRLGEFRMSDSQSHLFYLAADRLDDGSYFGRLLRSPRRREEVRLAPVLFPTDPSWRGK